MRRVGPLAAALGLGRVAGAILDALGLEWKDIFDTKEQAYDGRG